MRKIFVGGFFVALLATIISGYTVAHRYDVTPPHTTLCAAFPDYANLKYEYSAGLPIKWSKTIIENEDECASLMPANEYKIKATVMYAGSWQFYANWLLFSLPVILLMKLEKTKHAHNRH